MARNLTEGASKDPMSPQGTFLFCAQRNSAISRSQPAGLGSPSSYIKARVEAAHVEAQHWGLVGVGPLLPGLALGLRLPERGWKSSSGKKNDTQSGATGIIYIYIYVCVYIYIHGCPSNTTKQGRGDSGCFVGLLSILLNRGGGTSGFSCWFAFNATQKKKKRRGVPKKVSCPR